MCRNITELRGLEPPATREEIEAAARQYIRKVSGIAKPNEALAARLCGRSSERRRRRTRLDDRTVLRSRLRLHDHAADESPGGRAHGRRCRPGGADLRQRL